MKKTDVKTVLMIVSLILPLLPTVSVIAATQGPPWLGVLTKNLSFNQLEAMRLDYGVEIIKIYNNSPADQSDLAVGDIILEVDKKPVFSADRLRWLIHHSAIGKKIHIKYYRNKKINATMVMIKAKELLQEQRPFEELWRWPPSNTYIGATLQNMTEELREYFGAPDDLGVLIVELEKGAPAQHAGLKVGDVIIKLDRKRIKNARDIHRVLNFFEPGDKVTVELVRDKQTRSLEIKLAAHPNMPYEPPKELIDPHYWSEEMKELMERLQEYWRNLRKRDSRSTPDYV